MSSHETKQRGTLRKRLVGSRKHTLSSCWSTYNIPKPLLARAKTCESSFVMGPKPAFQISLQIHFHRKDFLQFLEFLRRFWRRPLHLESGASHPPTSEQVRKCSSVEQGKRVLSGGSHFTTVHSLPDRLTCHPLVPVAQRGPCWAIHSHHVKYQLLKIQR